MDAILKAFAKDPSQPFFHRRHEYGGQNRVRVWTLLDAMYGSFEVLSQDEFKTLQNTPGLQLIDADYD